MMRIATTVLSSLVLFGCIEPEQDSKTESNNSFETAQSIPTRTLVDGALTEDKDEVDYYSFQLSEDKEVFISIDPANSLSAQVSLYSENRDLIELTEIRYAPNRFSTTLNQGQYYLEIAQLQGSGDYRVKAGWDYLPSDLTSLEKIYAGDSFSDSTTISERNNYALLVVEETGDITLKLEANIEDEMSVIAYSSEESAFIKQFSLSSQNDNTYRRFFMEKGEYIVNVFLESPKDTTFTLSYIK